MSYDNRIFNVNGCGDKQLLATLKLAFAQADIGGCRQWVFTKEHGLILGWQVDRDQRMNMLPTDMDAEGVMPMVLAWLQSDDSKMTICKGDDSAYMGDGSNKDGWRVYCERYGHIGEFHATICAIKPVSLWLGK